MARYEITVESAAASVLEALEGFQVEEIIQGHSRLTGEVADQAAFYGMLNRLQGLRLEIIEIHPADDP